MPRRVFNWTFADVVALLKKYGFVCSHTEGSHFYYTGNYGGKPRIVQVPFHGSRSFKPRTLKGMVFQSGIPLSLWLER